MAKTTSFLSVLAAGAMALGAVALTPHQAEAADTYTLDKTHADVVFWVDHLGYSKTWGRFNAMDGTLVLDQDDPSQSAVAIVIQAATIDTNLKKRDAHLKSPDFLNVKEYPTITFNSTNVAPSGDKTATITGDFTLHGVTKSISFEATVNKVAPFAMDKSKEIVGISAETMIERTDYGMNYGAGAIGTEMPIFLELEFIRDIEG